MICTSVMEIHDRTKLNSTLNYTLVYIWYEFVGLVRDGRIQSSNIFRQPEIKLFVQYAESWEDINSPTDSSSSPSMRIELCYINIAFIGSILIKFRFVLGIHLSETCFSTFPQQSSSLVIFILCIFTFHPM